MCSFLKGFLSTIDISSLRLWKETNLWGVGSAVEHAGCTRQWESRCSTVSSITALSVCSSLQRMPYVCHVPVSAAKPVSNRGANIPKRFGTFPKCHFWLLWMNSEQWLTHHRESQTVSTDMGGSGLAHANRDGLHNGSSQWSNSSSSLKAIKTRWGL